MELKGRTPLVVVVVVVVGLLAAPVSQAVSVGGELDTQAMIACTAPTAECPAKFDCRVEITDCPTSKLSEGIRDIARPKDVRIQLIFNRTNVFEANTVPAIPECKLNRWLPEVRISWHDTLHDQNSEFLVMIQYTDMPGATFAPGGRTLALCLKLTSQRPWHWNNNEKVKFAVRCGKYDDGCLLLSRVVRLPLSTGLPDLSSPASVLSLPLNFSSNQGLPLDLEDVGIPQTEQQQSDGKVTFWRTSILLSNDSCDGSLHVLFQVAPPGNISFYKVELCDLEECKIVQNVTTGDVTFSSLSPNETYCVRVTPCFTVPQDTYSSCVGSREAPKQASCGISTWSASMSINGKDNHCQPDVEDTNGFYVWASCVGVILGFVLLLTLLLVTYFLCRKPGTTAERRPKIFLVHCKDSHLQSDLVHRFAEYLCTHGQCDVTLDLWRGPEISRSRARVWVSQRLQEADYVIILGSVGFSHCLKAMDNNRSYPKLDNSDPNSVVFREAVDALRCEKGTPCVTATFDFSSTTRIQKMMDFMKCASSNSSATTQNEIRTSLRHVVRAKHFSLLSDMEKLLSCIHGSNRWTSHWTNHLNTPAGKHLRAAVERLADFQKENPDWWENTYGPAEPYTKNPNHPPSNRPLRDEHTPLASSTHGLASFSDVAMPSDVTTDEYDVGREDAMTSCSVSDVTSMASEDDDDASLICLEPDEAPSEDMVSDDPWPYSDALTTMTYSNNDT